MHVYETGIRSNSISMLFIMLFSKIPNDLYFTTSISDDKHVNMCKTHLQEI